MWTSVSFCGFYWQDFSHQNSQHPTKINMSRCIKPCYAYTFNCWFINWKTRHPIKTFCKDMWVMDLRSRSIKPLHAVKQRSLQSSMLCFTIASFNSYCDRWMSIEEVFGVWRVTANPAEYGDVEVEGKKSIAFVIQTNSIANSYRRLRLIFSCCILCETIRSLQMHFAFYCFTQQTALLVPTAAEATLTDFSSAELVLKHCIVLCKAFSLIWTSLQ